MDPQSNQYRFVRVLSTGLDSDNSTNYLMLQEVYFGGYYRLGGGN